MTTTLAPPGLRCPSCRGVDLDLDGDRLTCTDCSAFVRLLQRHGDPPSEFDAGRAWGCPLLKGCWWLGMVKLDDGWTPVALAKSRGEVWDALLTFPGEAPRLLTPTDPPRWEDEL